jgi:hypothetical protein
LSEDVYINDSFVLERELDDDSDKNKRNNLFGEAIIYTSSIEKFITAILNKRIAVSGISVITE